MIMPRGSEIDFSEYNIVLYNLGLISYVPDKLVTIYIILLIPICEVVGVIFPVLLLIFIQTMASNEP